MMLSEKNQQREVLSRCVVLSLSCCHSVFCSLTRIDIWEGGKMEEPYGYLCLTFFYIFYQISCALFLLLCITYNTQTLLMHNGVGAWLLCFFAPFFFHLDACELGIYSQVTAMF